ncbi:MAG: 30S ribosomal protein S12 methylthiotransferase RimO [bacterium]|nr:30S ribosomal protein S12 methylthiotransferase RimO [bacterium]
MPTLYVVSLGCAKNRVDTELMLGALARCGWRLSPQPRWADVLLVNTCAFIHPAVREAERVIARLARAKRPAQKLVVCGCLVNRFPHGARHFNGAVDVWLHIADEARIADVLHTWFPTDAASAAPTRVRTTPRHYAYLRIADGCSHACSFCTIPHIRGPFRSVPLTQVMDEARRLVDDGVIELNVIAQDTGAYGRDTRPRTSLPALLERLCVLPGLRWVRLQYLHPVSVSDSLLAQFTSLPALCPYLDIPLQHIHDSVLRRMRRPAAAWTRALLERVRNRAPHVAIRTTFITGFPGESPSAFRELLTFVNEQRFHHLGVFAYSREEGTPAAQFPDQVSRSTALRRRARLLRAQQAIALAHNQALIGTTLDVVIDSRLPDGTARGRRRIDAPDVDATVHLSAHPACVPGAIVPVRITDAAPYDLYGVCTLPQPA